MIFFAIKDALEKTSRKIFLGRGHPLNSKTVTTQSLPLLALTMGDVAGTGPEIIAKTALMPQIRALSRPLVVGEAGVMRQALDICGVEAEVRPVASPAEARFEPGTIELIDLANIDLSRFERGRVDPMAGNAAYEYVCEATRLALAGEVEAIVTAPLNKESMNKAGHHYDGHTGLLRHLCDAPDATMMLVADKLRVAHVSTHVALREAIDRVRPERIVRVIELTHQALVDMGIERPSIAVAGLNPHAGEDGLFGDEESKYIVPALEQARGLGYNVSGPHPGDTIFFRTHQGEFDGSVAMYHDQGHVAAKMLGIWLGVNVSLGLPIIRTSVEHGTAFDKAGKGTADPRSMIEAIKLAAAMADRRSPRTKPSIPAQ